VAESALAYRPGAVWRMDFPTPPQLRVNAGTHTGYVFDAHGTVTGSTTVSYGRPRGVLVTAWAVINGRSRYLVGSGPLSGTWLEESGVASLQV
jgi:hypothetical protein